MRKLFAMSLLVAGFAAVASAGTVPEIDPNSALPVFALLASGVLMVRAGRNKSDRNK